MNLKFDLIFISCARAAAGLDLIQTLMSNEQKRTIFGTKLAFYL